MKDNDVIKALECCIRNEYCCTCEECPLDTYPQCEEVLYRETVDLINRQKAEIKQKDTEIGILIRKKETLRDELAEKQAEIERLQDIIISNDEERLSSSAIMMKKEQELMHAERISGLEAEIERLQKQLKEGIDLSDSVVKIFKSEARKEFAERLKEYGYVPQLSLTGEAVVDVEDIDNLLEEMESERK